MRKLFYAIIIVLIISVFAGCSKSEASSQTSSKATKAAVEEKTEAETQANTQKITTTDEFPTVADDES